jgi:hypothetical protein
MTTPTTFSGLVTELLRLGNMIVVFIFGIVFLFLVWKIFDTWVIHGDDEKKREEGKQHAVVAVVVMVLMIVIWGVVEMLRVSLFT